MGPTCRNGTISVRPAILFWAADCPHLPRYQGGGRGGVQPSGPGSTANHQKSDWTTGLSSIGELSTAGETSSCRPRVAGGRQEL